MVNSDSSIIETQEWASYNAWQARRDIDFAENLYDMNRYECFMQSAIFHQQEAAHFAECARHMLGII